MSQNNFWSDVEKGMSDYLLKYINIFEEEYQKDESEKNKKVEAFLAGIKVKDNFEDLFNFVKEEIKPLFDAIRTEYLGDKKPEEVEQKKINTLIEVSKLFNAIIPLPRFLSEFMKESKEASPVDLNKLFVYMMKFEVDEITRIFNDEVKGLDMAVDGVVKDINDSEDALEIWNLINQFGLFLQRDIALTNFKKDEEEKRLQKQLDNIDSIEKDFNEGKIKLPEFNKAKIVTEIKDYSAFVISLSNEKREEISEKVTAYRNKVVPLVQIIQCLHDLLFSILTATNIINQKEN